MYLCIYFLCFFCFFFFEALVIHKSALTCDLLASQWLTNTKTDDTSVYLAQSVSGLTTFHVNTCVRSDAGLQPVQHKCNIDLKQMFTFVVPGSKSCNFWKICRQWPLMFIVPWVIRERMSSRNNRPEQSYITCKLQKEVKPWIIKKLKKMDQSLMCQHSGETSSFFFPPTLIPSLAAAWEHHGREYKYSPSKHSLLFHSSTVCKRIRTFPQTAGDSYLSWADMLHH